MPTFCKQTKLIGLMLLISLALGACSSGSSDNGPPPNTKTTANVSNQTTSNFASVSIEEHATGKAFYSGAFDCAAKQTDCKLYYTGSDITGPAVLLFKDAQGHVVGIYDVDNAPGSYMAPEVTLWTTGAYLYETLANLSTDFKNMSEVERQAALAVFVSEKDAIENASPIDTTNPLADQTGHYEELALNYLNKQSGGPVTIANYVDELAKRLANRDVASSTEFLIPTSFIKTSMSTLRYALTNRMMMFQAMDWISTAHAQDATSSCTSGVATFMSIFQGITGAVPSSFPIAAGVAKTIGAAGFAACNPQKVKLDSMINQLVNVQNSLDNLTDDVGKLSNFVASAQMNTNLQDFTTVSSDLSMLASNYQTIIGNYEVGSLKEYVKKFGGSGEDALRIVLNKEPDGVFAKLLGRLPATSDQSYLLQIQRLTENQFDTLNAAMDLLCKSPSTGDVLKLRVQCNLVIGTTTARLLAAQNIAYQIASDTYDLLEAYPTEATRYGYDLRKTAAENKVALKTKFDSQANLMVAKYNNTVQNSSGTRGIYDTFDGLPTDLLSSISAANCSGNQENPNARVQSILGWVKQGRNEYIVTNCKNFSTPILARYYLKVDGSTVNSNDVGNVMGVLVPYAQMSNWGGVNYGSAPEAYYNTINLVLQPSPVPYTFAINSVSNGSSRWIYDQLFAGGNDLYSRLTKVTGEALNSTLPTWVDQLSAGGCSDGFNCNSWKQFIRYTDKSGYSVVFALRMGYEYYTGGSTHTLYYCITGDCTNKVSEGELSFKDGPLALKLDNKWFYIDGQNPYKW